MFKRYKAASDNPNNNAQTESPEPWRKSCGASSCTATKGLQALIISREIAFGSSNSEKGYNLAPKRSSIQRTIFANAKS